MKYETKSYMYRYKIHEFRYRTFRIKIPCKIKYHNELKYYKCKEFALTHRLIKIKLDLTKYHSGMCKLYKKKIDNGYKYIPYVCNVS